MEMGPSDPLLWRDQEHPNMKLTMGRKRHTVGEGIWGKFPDTHFMKA